MAIVTLKRGTVIIDSLCDPDLKLRAVKVKERKAYCYGQWAISLSQLGLMDPIAKRLTSTPVLYFNDNEVEVH